MDPVGDKDALRYSISASHSAPRYNRDGQGRVFGLDDGIRIVFSRDRTEQGVEVAPKGRPYIPRYSARILEGSASRHLGRLLLRPDDTSTFDSAAAFVAVDAPRARQLEVDDTPDYRSLSRPSSLQQDDELQTGESTLSGFSTLEADVRRQTAEMERHVKAKPTDVEAWIAYSTLHLKLSPDYVPNALVDPLSLPQSRATAEVTLSILARGLEAHPSNFLSPTLHIAYIRAAEKFWPLEKVTGRWKNVLRELGERVGTPGAEDLEEGMMSVWLGYIEWREGQGFGKSDDRGAGGVDEVIDVYIECLGKLTKGDISKQVQSREENQLYLFLRACIFMKQAGELKPLMLIRLTNRAGYGERALACFQALMEITFFKPDHLRPTSQSGSEWFQRLLSDFEVFWDEEVPRFGDPRSKGWRDARSDDPSPPEYPEMTHVSEDPFEKWLEAERHADEVMRTPGRSKNLDDEEDPFRVVLYADIQPFLFPIRSPQVRLQLVYAYLAFIGLPFCPPDVPTTSPTASDPHLRSELAYNDAVRAVFWPPRTDVRRIPWQTVGGEPMMPEVSTVLADPFGSPVKCWASERNTLFAQSARWFRDLNGADLAHVDVELARNSFMLLRPLIPDPSFTLAYFAFEAAVSPKSAVKAAKAILADDRDNLVLWDGYARLERQRGNATAARTVYVTALQAAMAEGSTADDEERLEVWSSWAEMEFEHDEARCLAVILMAAGFDLQGLARSASTDGVTQPPSAITMLKARQVRLSRSDEILC